MKSLLIALLLLAPAPLLAQEALAASSIEQNEPVAVPFHFSSFDTAFAMQGDFEGEYRIYPTSVEVRLTKAVVRIALHCPYKGRREFSALSFALATKKPDRGWTKVFKSPQLPVRLIMSPGDEHTFEGEIHFSIPKELTTDLSQHWLMAEMEDIVLDRPVGQLLRMGYAYATSRKDIFQIPF